MFAVAISGMVVARTLPAPRGLLAQLAPESLTRCGHETPKGFFECVTALTVETILLTMIYLKVRKSWTHVGPSPLLRALLLDGAAYYVALSLALSLEIASSMHSEIYYYIADTNFAVCVGVIACNHLMLSLRETRDHPMKPFSGFSQHITDVAFAPQTSDIAYTYVGPSQTIPPPQHDVSINWNQEQVNLAQKPGIWHEMRPYRGPTARVPFEMDLKR